MIGRIGLGELLESSRGCPVKLARVDDDAADAGAMAAQKLGGGVDHDVRAPLDGAHQGRRWRGVIDHQRQSIFVRDGGEAFDVDDVELRVADALGVDGAGLVVDRGAQAVEIVSIDEADGDAEARQGVVEEVIGAAVERSGGDDFFAGRGEGGDGERFRRLAGGRGQARRAAFERRNALFENVGGGIHDAGVDIPEFLEREETAGVVRILEKIGRGLVDGDGARPRGGIRGLTGMDGKSGKLELLGFGHDGLSFGYCKWGGRVSRIIGSFSTYRVPGNKMSRIRHLHVNAMSGAITRRSRIEKHVIPKTP